MKVYIYRKTRAKIGIIALFIFLVFVLMLIRVLGAMDVFLVALVILALMFIIIVLRITKKMIRYKAIITDDALSVTTIDTPVDLSYKMLWSEVQNITYCGSRIFDKTICISGKYEKIRFKLNAFCEYKDLLKEIIEHSSNNDGFYTDQKVLGIIKG